MKKILFIAAAALTLGASAAGITKAKISAETQSMLNEETIVYICTGGSSKKYHSTSSCSGLRNCGGEVKEITLEKAQKMGRTPCKICYN